MKEIILNKTKDFQIGNVRFSKETFDKVTKLAKANKVSNQVIVRVVVDNFVDEVKLI